MKIALLIVFSAVFLLIFSLIFSGVLMSLIKIPAATKRAFGSRLLGLKMVVKWFALLWVGLIVEFVACCITPFVVLFANHHTGRLPIGFRWMETHDALLCGYPAVQGFTLPDPNGWWAWYWRSVCWLYRNRVYRFSADVMGVYCDNESRREIFGTPNISDDFPFVLGSFVEVSEKCFEYSSIFPAFGRLWGFRVGYKMRSVRGKAGYAQHVIRILPVVKK